MKLVAANVCMLVASLWVYVTIVPTACHKTSLLTPHRRRGQKMAIDRLKKALSEYPSGLSLQTTLKAAVEEVTVSVHVYYILNSSHTYKLYVLAL